MWFASNILAEPLLADRVILKPIFPLMLSNELKIHEFQLINILLTASDQIQKLVDMVDPSQHQTHILV